MDQFRIKISQCEQKEKFKYTDSLSLLVPAETYHKCGMYSVLSKAHKIVPHKPTHNGSFSYKYGMESETFYRMSNYFMSSFPPEDQCYQFVVLKRCWFQMLTFDIWR